MYRCPKCKKSLTYEVVESSRSLFYCNNCNIGRVIDELNSDNAYIAFLDLYDNNELYKTSLEDLLIKECIIRSEEDIRRMLNYSDQTLYDILNTKKDYVVDHKLIIESKPELGKEIDGFIDEHLCNVLKKYNIYRLYKFQEEAINAIREGKDIVIVAPTSSGKTEAFTLPVLEGIKEHGKALFVYPTKALARDQVNKIAIYANAIGLKIGVMDGDISNDERRRIIEQDPKIILTNFDTIHYHLMYRTQFSNNLRDIRYLIIDEVHTYTGIFGTHVHYIIKRLARFNKMQIIAASATLPNAKEFCESLVGRRLKIIEGKGRRSSIYLTLLYPTLRSERALVLYLLSKLAKKHKSIVFSNSHLSAELLAYYGSKQGINIKVHRAGLSKSYRTKVENDFKNGALMVISSTPTLELGIDIGSLDIVISSKAPITRLLQRFGRAGRREESGYAFLVFGNDPISQYYKNHPNDYFKDLEYAYIDPYNYTIQRYQILAMAMDKPLPESYYDEYANVIDELINEGLLKHVNNLFIPNYKEAIKELHSINIRGSSDVIKVYINNKEVDERSLPIALEELHNDAVYFIAGKRYKVNKLDLKEKKAYLTSLPNNYPYYTKALSESWPSIEDIYEQRYAYNIEVYHCLLNITKRVVGYSNIEIGSDINKGKKVMLNNILEYNFMTKGLVLRVPRPIDNIKSAKDPRDLEISAYHAVEHVMIEGSNMITGGVSQDLGGISLGSSGLIFIYDSNIGGNGASKILYDRLEDVFARGKSILEECNCNKEDGCPRCTYSYRCGNNNEFLHKYAALEIFKRILSGENREIMNVEGDLSLV